MCEHISKVLEWGFTDTHDFKAIKYGCTNCEETSPVPFRARDVFIDHSTCGGPDVCFGCKAAGLQLSTGDASNQKSTTNKKWEGELNAYREARSQGIQPAGTSMKQINEARRASDAMGAAYDSNHMPSTNLIQNKTVSKLKEVGLV
jgi:hypothetical protein